MISDKELHNRFTSLFSQIAAGAVEREKKRQLPYQEIKSLQQAGFGSVRLPVELGGLGASIRQLFGLLIELAAADSNISQAFRPHLAFVEETRLSALSGNNNSQKYINLILAGNFFGNAITEQGQGAVKRYKTSVTQGSSGWMLNGEKFYSTGSLYADYIVVAADKNGERASVLVPANADGLTQEDDWDGFGQRLTASGHSSYTNVPVCEENIMLGGYGTLGRTWGTAYLQLILLATLAGITRRVELDAITWVRQRTRTFSHASEALPKDDPLVQEIIGKLSAAAFSTRATVLAVADLLDDIVNTGTNDPQSLDQAERAAAQAQDTVVRQTLDACTLFFETGGASLVSSTHMYDRHWRNARTIATHNPLIYKMRALGANLLNDDPLPYEWSAGIRPAEVL